MVPIVLVPVVAVVRAVVVAEATTLAARAQLEVGRGKRALAREPSEFQQCCCLRLMVEEAERHWR